MGSALLLGIAATAAATSAPSSAIFRHHDVNRPVFYGAQFPGGRGPSAFIEATAADVARYLREDPDGPFGVSTEDWYKACQKLGGNLSNAKRWKSWGFASDGIDPILKADWHSVPLLGPRNEVFTPRSSKVSVMRQAPPRIMAFLEAFRDVNSGCWDQIVQALEGVLTREQEKDSRGDGQRPFDEARGLGRLSRIFKSAFERKGHFGVVEAQVWCGDRLSMRSHLDGATSMLHLSLTLGGRRTLRVGRFTERHSPSAARSDDGHMPWKSRRRMAANRNENDVWASSYQDSSHLLDIEMAAGSAYLSMPYCFEHGVRYPSSIGHDPIMALQCRFAFLNATDAQHVNGLRDGGMREIAKLVSEEIAASVNRGELRVPTVAEVIERLPQKATPAASKPTQLRPAASHATASHPGSAPTVALVYDAQSPRRVHPFDVFRDVSATATRLAVGFVALAPWGRRTAFKLRLGPTR